MLAVSSTCTSIIYSTEYQQFFFSCEISLFRVSWQSVISLFNIHQQVIHCLLCSVLEVSNSTVFADFPSEK